jgi:hypothetical protein
MSAFDNLDVRMLSINHPVLKLVWMIIRLVTREKAKLVTFTCKAEEENRPHVFIIAKEDDKYEMVPPPRHLFPLMLAILRRIGDAASKNPASAFHVVYEATEKEETLDVYVKYDTGSDPDIELAGLITAILNEDEAKERAEKKLARKAFLAHWFNLIAIAILSAIIGCLVVSLF